MAKYQDLYEKGRETFGEDAVALYTESLKWYAGGDNVSWLCRAEELNGLQRYEEALHDAEKWIGDKPNPSRFMGWFQKGLALFGLERYEEALASFDEAIRLNHGWCQFYLARAATKQALGMEYREDIKLAKEWG